MWGQTAPTPTASSLVETSRLRGRLQRFQPERLKDDALNAITDYIDDATEITVATIKEHPVVFGTSFLGTLAFWYRKPLIRKSPDAIDSVGTGLAKLRDWVAPESWTSSASDKE